MGLKVGQSEKVDKVVGANLRIFRNRNGLSQLALAAEVGISFQQIQKYEKGSNRIGASRLWEFCSIFDVTPDDFFLGVLNNDQSGESYVSEEMSFFQHPKALTLARAFLAIKNHRVEKGVIELLKSLSAG